LEHCDRRRTVYRISADHDALGNTAASNFHVNYVTDRMSRCAALLSVSLTCQCGRTGEHHSHDATPNQLRCFHKIYISFETIERNTIYLTNREGHLSGREMTDLQLLLRAD
jgi:hypothetical protein